MLAGQKSKILPKKGLLLTAKSKGTRLAVVAPKAIV
jgi:hypothetical protein